MQKNLIFLIIFLFFLFFLKSIEAKVLINEFLIEPTPQQAEIINIGTESANISGWVIDDDGGSSTTFIIPENTIIYPNSCLVFSGNFYLNTRSADTIRLFDNQNNLIDSFSYRLSFGQGISYQRIPDGENSWSTQSASLGLFNSSLTSCIITPTPSFFPTQTPTIFQSPTPTISPTLSLSPTSNPTPTPTLALVSYQNIYLSEVYPNPQTGEKEWVEIYNDNDFIVNLNNWHIDDIEDGGSSPKKFSLTIEPKSYGSVDLSTAMFNNDGDAVRLLDFEKKEKDSFEYKDSQKGKSFGRVSFETDEFCLQEPSKNQKNNLCFNLALTKETISTESLITFTPSSSIISPTKSVFPINKAINKKVNQNPYYYKNYFQITPTFKKDELNDLTLINKKINILGVSKKRKHRFLSLFLVSFSYSILSAVGVILKTFKDFS